MKNLIKLITLSIYFRLHNNRFFRENPKNLFVRVGSDYFYKAGEKINVIETYFHPSYDPRTLHDNLVILRLEYLIKFLRQQKKIRRILYDRIPQHLPSNTDGILILGWGSLKVCSISRTCVLNTNNIMDKSNIKMDLNLRLRAVRASHFTDYASVVTDQEFEFVNCILKVLIF